jgi:hypothetical protein
MDLVDVVGQIYGARDIVQKIYSDLGDNISEIKKMLNVFVELPSVDVDLVGNLVIEKNIGEERYIPFWLRLLLYPFRNIGDDKVIVDSLALHIYEDKGVSFDLKVCYIVPATSEYLHRPDRIYECSMFSFTLLSNRKNMTPLGTLITFAYLTTEDDWRYIMDELNKLAAKKSELEKAVSQLKASIVTLKLVS